MLDSSARLDNPKWLVVEGAIMDIGGWLRTLGLERYEGAFRENEINEKVLPNLTAEDLKDMGVSIVGHRPPQRRGSDPGL